MHYISKLINFIKMHLRLYDDRFRFWLKINPIVFDEFNLFFN